MHHGCGARDGTGSPAGNLSRDVIAIADGPIRITHRRTTESLETCDSVLAGGEGVVEQEP